MSPSRVITRATLILLAAGFVVSPVHAGSASVEFEPSEHTIRPFVPVFLGVKIMPGCDAGSLSIELEVGDVPAGAEIHPDRWNATIGCSLEPHWFRDVFRTSITNEVAPEQILTFSGLQKTSRAGQASEGTWSFNLTSEFGGQITANLPSPIRVSKGSPVNVPLIASWSVNAPAEAIVSLEGLDHSRVQVSPLTMTFNLDLPGGPQQPFRIDASDAPLGRLSLSIKTTLIYDGRSYDSHHSGATIIVQALPRNLTGPHGAESLAFLLSAVALAGWLGRRRVG